MRIRNRSFLALFTTTCLAAAVSSAAQAQATRWSDPATWPDNKVPAAGEQVTIASGKEVILDVSPPALGGITINGTLRFADESDLELNTEWIMLHGELEIGTEAKPFTHNATITLTDNVKDEQLMGMGDRGIMLSGGTLNLHGNRSNTWTKLAATAEAGSSTIEVLNANQWQVGDEIVLASTDYDPRQAERRTITAISGNSITLNQPLEYMHFGKITFEVDERGEVGLLTRNIKVQASEDAAETYFGGHIMAMVTSKMFIEGVELNRMGQHLELARYPIHWHLVGDGGKGQYIKNAAIHDTFNRCVTVHGTNDLQVHNNVTYNTVGHCFFMEDGIEHGNEYVSNLAIQVKCHPTLPCVPTTLAASGESIARMNGQNSTDVLLPSDNTVAAYWITNPDNIYRNNVAAGTDSNGFWMSLPEHPNGAFLDSEASLNTWPRNTAIREFKGNVAHSTYDGFMMDRNIAVNNTFGVTGNMHLPRENPADTSSRLLESEFADLTAYKNRNGGYWGRGEYRTIRNYRAADNAIGYTQASGLMGGASLEDPYTSLVIDSLFVGETENIGNPRTPEEIAYGRSLPKPELPDFPIRGYEYYDNRHDVVSSKFVNYADNDTRKTGAISYLLYTSFGVSSNNSVEKLSFENAKPIYFPPMDGNARWANDNGNSSAYKTAVIRDKDGSLGAGPDTYIMMYDGVNDSVAIHNEYCQINSDWNAAVCSGDVGRLSFTAPLRLGGAGGPGGPGGPGAGAPPRVGGGAAGPGAGAAGPGAVAAGPGAGAPAAGGPAAGGPGGAPRAPGGLFGAPQPPITLSTSEREQIITAGGANVRTESEIKLTTERPQLSLRLTEMDQGSWVIFELPGFNTADSGAQQNSLTALRDANETSWYKDADALWVKVVSPDNGPLGLGGATAVAVSR
jgi:hypothetical protein